MVREALVPHAASRGEDMERELAGARGFRAADGVHTVEPRDVLVARRGERGDRREFSERRAIAKIIAQGRVRPTCRRPSPPGAERDRASCVGSPPAAP